MKHGETSKMPIKRHKNLQPLSRDHHQGLLLSWKINTGLKNNIATERISDYVRFFFKEELEPHFMVEEEKIFTLLPSSHPMIIRAKKEHSDLRKILELKKHTAEQLLALSEKLNAHIRFEERVLFREIQNSSPGTALEKLHLADHRSTADNFHDKFWII